jgi:hypothetical protein
MPFRARFFPFWAVLAGLLSSFGWASTALAHPLVDHGYRLYEGADFQGALHAFEAAEAASDLTRDDLIKLLEGRALAHLALGNEEPMEATLVQLASVEPDREMGRAIPPPMRDAFDRISGSTQRISITARVEAMPGGARVVAEVNGDSGGLVREVRLAGRELDDDRWTSGTGEELSVVASSGATIEYHAAAIGPGGAVITRAGSEESPLSASTEGVEEGEILTSSEDGDDDGGGVLVPILIGVGAAVVIATVIIIVVAASSGGQSDETQFSAPSWPM